MSSKRRWCPSLIPAFSLVAGLGGASVISHHTADTVEVHVAAAKVAAGTAWAFTTSAGIILIDTLWDW